MSAAIPYILKIMGLLQFIPEMAIRLFWNSTAPKRPLLGRSHLGAYVRITPRSLKEMPIGTYFA